MLINVTLIAIIAAIIGLLVGGIVIWLMAPSFMMREDVSQFDFEKTVDTLVATAEEMKWKVPIIHHLHKSMEKAGVGSVLRASVIEICQPEYAVQLLKEDHTKIVSSLMPCRIAVYEQKDGSVIISRMNTGMMAKMFGGLVTKVMAIASQGSEKITNSVLR